MRAPTAAACRSVACGGVAPATGAIVLAICLCESEALIRTMYYELLLRIIH